MEQLCEFQTINIKVDIFYDAGEKTRSKIIFYEETESSEY